MQFAKWGVVVVRPYLGYTLATPSLESEPPLPDKSHEPELLSRNWPSGVR
jgi:hypothetical protein